MLELSSEPMLTGALRNYSLDAIIAPGIYVSGLSAALGTPAVIVPMAAMPDGSPVVRNSFGNLNTTGPNQPLGLGFAGAAFSEIALIEMAYAFEQKTMVRKKIKPYIQPKTELVDILSEKTRQAQEDKQEGKSDV